MNEEAAVAAVRSARDGFIPHRECLYGIAGKYFRCRTASDRAAADFDRDMGPYLGATHTDVDESSIVGCIDICEPDADLIDAGLFDAAERRIVQNYVYDSPPPPRRIPFHARSCSIGGDEVLYLEANQTMIVVASRDRHITVAGRDPVHSARLFTKDALRGSIWNDVTTFHSAAVELDGAAALIAGNKGAGKTSLTCELISIGGARFLANDRAIVHSRDGISQVSGWPNFMRVAPGTVARLARAGHSLSDVDGPLINGKISLDPVQIAARIGSVTRGPVPLRACLFPRLGDNFSPPKLLGVDDAAARLAENEMRWPEFEWPHWTQFEPSVGAVSRGPSIQELARTVPCYEVELPLDGTWPVDQITAVLQS